ncbi:MAG: signal peptide peptidase SppA [Rikenellaceae bacterium]|nr:signal peptide peptidase SppA [Rikenellaceae bacterium]MBP3612377.1 signal peptide peptidase SppA [Rikenellaceae bacterium]
MNFFKTFLASLLAFFVANFVWFFLFIIIVAGIAAIGSSTTIVEPKSVLKIDLSESIVDQPVNDPLAGFDPMSMNVQKSVSNMQVMNAIESAAQDDNIEGIYINLTGAGTASAALLEEVRDYITAFKESGKFVVAYGEVYSQGGYYLASVADSIYLNPVGEMDWRGLAMQVMFYKGALDKLGIEPQVFRHGTFKSAVEPYIMSRMSPENRTQMETIASSIWGTMVADIAKERNLSIDSLNMFATDLSAMMAEDALANRMVDGLKYEDEVEDILREKLELDADEDITFVTLGEYIAANPYTPTYSDNKIEVIYAEGQIVQGTSEQGTLGSSTLADQLAEARMDEEVKAVVLRVNSPGGSALASEVIWREMELLRQQKPVIVSMGDYAASGGYYISAPADAIIADATTLTGSIGVFGLMFNAEKALNNKLGITIDVAKTNPSADMGMPFRAVSSSERAHIMRSIEQVYSTFVNHVADGRNMTFDSVDAIGQGRVWTGNDGNRIGLVDEIGGLKYAIAVAADKAECLDDYMVRESMGEPTGLAALLSSLEAHISDRKMRKEMGAMYDEYRSLRALMENEGVQALALPIEIR